MFLDVFTLTIHNLKLCNVKEHYNDSLDKVRGS